MVIFHEVFQISRNRKLKQRRTLEMDKQRKLSYAELIEANCSRNPCLLALRAFLSNPTAGTTHTERITSLNFSPGDTNPVLKRITPSDLTREIQEIIPPDEKHLSPTMAGQIFLIENISRESVSALGSILNIDPIFFASHIHSAWRDVESQSPKFCELPSQMRQQNFATFSYHQSLLFPEIEERDYRLLCPSNVPRKIAVLSGVKGQRVGLAQRCCSVFTVQRDIGWLGLVLVDPPIRDSYLSVRRHDTAFIRTPSAPLFGGSEDFLSTTKSAFNRHSIPSADQPMFEKLLYYWTTGQPDGFTPKLLTMRALSYYPLRIIAAEWVSYLGLMSLSLRQYDRPPLVNETSAQELSRMNLSLTSVSSWPRRIASSTTSLRKCIDFIKHHGRAGPSSDSWASLQEDYEHLAMKLSQQGKQLETAVPLVTAYLQLAESRRTYSEAKNVTRLTVLSLFFMPLSFVSSLFSMSENILPSGPQFWLYFAVAGPVLIVVLLAASPATYSYMRRCGMIVDKLGLR
ncbi:hypothetical protein F4803DRAFT_528000 [Xylaria telfairii]|nr:hypothetical protein F4803DRAFT_528000 [Xylaria telfairii]